MSAVALAEPDELCEALDRVGAHRRRPRRDEERDTDQREGAAAAESGDGAGAEKHRGESEPEAEHGRHRAGEDDPEPTRDERDDRPAPPRRPSVGERDPDRADHQHGARQRGEVMDPDEGRLSLTRSLPLELGHDPEELEQPPRGRRDAPGDEGADDRDEVDGRADEQHGRGQKRRVPAELCEADRVAREVVLLAEERGRRK